MQLWRRARWRVRIVGIVSALLLLSSLAGAYQLRRSAGPPSFSRGGAFQGAAQSSSRPAGGAESPAASGDEGGATTVTSAPKGTPSTTKPAAAGGVTSTPGRGGAQTASPPEQPGALRPDDGLPDGGVYAYRVEGWEGATGFGRRDYPEQMVLTVHRDADDLQEDEVVFDLEFSSQHEEREVVAYRGDGVAFTFEGGSVTFGPRTETSQADYDPPMVQIPLPLSDGALRTGTTRAVDDSGNTVRTEDWQARVIRQERVETGLGAVDAWVVTLDRATQPGSSEQLERHRTYWYDPERRLSVQWNEQLHGERGFAPFTFTYDTEYTADLQSFQPR